MNSKQWSKLTDEEKRIKVAELHGWHWEDFMVGEDRLQAWFHPDKGHHCGTDCLPDYLNDLNAMHEAEQMLHGEKGTEYLTQLSAICNCTLGETICSTAAQRAEAFALTMEDV